MNLASYTSPDGLLTLVIEKASDGETAVGFKGYAWHTHPDILVGTYGSNEEEALKYFVSAILESREVILVYRKNGGVVDAFVSDNLRASLEYSRDDEELELRYWNGTTVDPTKHLSDAG